MWLDAPQLLPKLNPEARAEFKRSLDGLQQQPFTELENVRRLQAIAGLYQSPRDMGRPLQNIQALAAAKPLYGVDQGARSYRPHQEVLQNLKAQASFPRSWGYLVLAGRRKDTRPKSNVGSLKSLQSGCVSHPLMTREYPQNLITGQRNGLNR